MKELTLQQKSALVFKEHRYQCAYCGYDGREFDKWRYMEIDHVRPRTSGGDDSIENLRSACGSCNKIMNRMKFGANMTIEEIIKEKVNYVKRQLVEHRKYWEKLNTFG